VSTAIAIAKDRALPLDAVTQTFAFIARRGAGKTYCASKLVEEMISVAGAPVIVFDPVGNWYGLRLGADGKSAGLPIPVLGGLRGDVPLTPEAGRLVAELVMGRGMSAVLDVSSFRKGERKRFVTDFAERLFELAKAALSPMHVVFEEAQVFCPQFTGKDEKRMLGAIEDIVRLGRNYGLGSTLISQRPQSVNKEVLNQVECLFLGQLSGAHERKAINDWVVTNAEGGRANTDALPSLPVGTMMMWSPQWLGVYEKVRIAKKRTYDASATPTMGKKRSPARELTPIDMDELRTALAEVEKKATADDPKTYQRRIAELEKQLAEATRDPQVVVEKPGLPALTALQGAVIEVKAMVDSLVKGHPGFSPSTAAALMKPATSRSPAAVRTPQPQREEVPAPVEGLSRAERMVLTALAQHGSLSLQQAAIITGYAAKSSGMRNAAAKLRTLGYVLGPNARMTATGTGLFALGDWSSLPTGRDLAHYWYCKLSKAEREILTVLVGCYPAARSLAELAEATGYQPSSSGMRNAAAKLRTLMLVEGPNAGMRASERLVD
jgi:hypothetical protein